MIPLIVIELGYVKKEIMLIIKELC